MFVGGVKAETTDDTIRGNDSFHTKPKDDHLTSAILVLIFIVDGLNIILSR